MLLSDSNNKWHGRIIWRRKGNWPSIWSGTCTRKWTFPMNHWSGIIEAGFLFQLHWIRNNHKFILPSKPKQVKRKQWFDCHEAVYVLITAIAHCLWERPFRNATGIAGQQLEIGPGGKNCDKRIVRKSESRCSLHYLRKRQLHTMFRWMQPWGWALCYRQRTNYNPMFFHEDGLHSGSDHGLGDCILQH